MGKRNIGMGRYGDGKTYRGKGGRKKRGNTWGERVRRLK